MSDKQIRADAENSNDELIKTARTILDQVTQATLSSVAASQIGAAPAGMPYGSLVLVGQDPADGAPVLLLSSLARHTQNLTRDARGSLLFAPPPPDGSGPLEGARLTLMGRFLPLKSDSVAAAYIERHKDAALYIDFADFGFWRLEVLGAHLVAGFGKISEIPVNSLIYKRF